MTIVLLPGPYCHELPDGQPLNVNRQLGREQIDVVAQILERAMVSTADAFLVEFDSESPIVVGYYRTNDQGRRYLDGDAVARGWITL